MASRGRLDNGLFDTEEYALGGVLSVGVPEKCGNQIQFRIQQAIVDPQRVYRHLQGTRQQGGLQHEGLVICVPLAHVALTRSLTGPDAVNGSKQTKRTGPLAIIIEVRLFMSVSFMLRCAAVPRAGRADLPSTGPLQQVPGRPEAADIATGGRC